MKNANETKTDRALNRAWNTAAAAASDHETLAMLRLAFESFDAVLVKLTTAQMARLEDEYCEGRGFVVLNGSTVVFYTTDDADAARSIRDSVEERQDAAVMGVFFDMTEGQEAFTRRAVAKSMEGAAAKIDRAATRVAATL